jgi:hypothetical protein
LTRAAAIASILFSILLITGVVLLGFLTAPDLGWGHPALFHSRRGHLDAERLQPPQDSW